MHGFIQWLPWPHRIPALQRACVCLKATADWYGNPTNTRQPPKNEVRRRLPTCTEGGPEIEIGCHGRTRHDLSRICVEIGHSDEMGYLIPSLTILRSRPFQAAHFHRTPLR